MKTIAFASLKGGVGKSTLAFNVAVYAAKQGESIWLADVDPQRSLETFAERRPGENPAIIENVKSVRQLVSDLRVAKSERDWLICDTPASFVKIIEDALKPAKVVVVPTRPSIFDLSAQEDLLPILKNLGKEGVTIPVLNAVDGRTAHDDYVARLVEMFGRPPVLIHHRSAYTRSMIGSLAGFELDRKCTPEIQALWSEILTVTRTTK